ERQQEDAVGLVADGAGALLALADRLEHPAERRIDDSLDQQQREDDDDQHEEVAILGVAEPFERDRADERNVEVGDWDVAETVVAAGDVAILLKYEEDHLVEGERQHREVDLAATQAEPAQDRGGEAGEQ